MKALKFASILLLSVTTFFACKKEKDEQPPFAMEGRWTGKIGTGPVTPASQFSINLKPGGVIERINANGGVSGTGNWSLVNNEFAGAYVLSSGTQIVLQGTFDKSVKRLSGNWSNGSETGSWNATKE